MNVPSTRSRAAPTKSLLLQRIVGPVLTIVVVACGGSHAAPAHHGAQATAEAPGSEPEHQAGGGRSGAPPDAEPARTTGEEPASEAVASASTTEATAATPSPSLPDLPRGTTILHIGDSFAGALGIDLNVELKAAGVRGILRYETATYIPTWAFGKQIDQYLSQFNPDLVLVTLGANELQIPDPAARVPTIHRLVARLGGRPCVWVGPPLWAGARPALLDTIREACAPCVYLDSNALVPDLPRARDHIHPSMEARKTWAKAVFGWLSTHRAPDGHLPWEVRL